MGVTCFRCRCACSSVGFCNRPLPLCVLKVGERYPAPTQNQRALGENLHPLQSAWTMERLLGANLLGAVGAGETATQTVMAGATQRCHLRLANQVNSEFLCCFTSSAFL